MPDSKESAIENETPNFIHNGINSIADRLSVGPLNLVNRLKSPLSKHSQDSIDAEINKNDENSSTSSSSNKPVTNKEMPLHNRAVSVKSRASEPTGQSQKLRMPSSTSADSNRLSRSQRRTSNSLTMPKPGTLDADFNFSDTYKTMRELAERSCSYFSKEKNSDVCQKFERLLSLLLHSLEIVVPIIDYLIENFTRFDYSPEVI